MHRAHKDHSRKFQFYALDSIRQTLSLFELSIHLIVLYCISLLVTLSHKKIKFCQIVMEVWDKNGL